MKLFSNNCHLVVARTLDEAKFIFMRMTGNEDDYFGDVNDGKWSTHSDNEYIFIPIRNVQSEFVLVGKSAEE